VTRDFSVVLTGRIHVNAPRASEVGSAGHDSRNGATLVLPTGGTWQVTTETSTYLLDLDRQHITRMPDAGAGSVPGLGPVAVATLRRDYESIPLLDLISCELGSRMQLLLDIRGDGIATLRTTTIVRELHVLPGSGQRQVAGSHGH
jgi:hypothetical protein